MEYHDMIKRVQDYSGFSDDESETALRLFIEKLSARLTEEEREDFASQLPTDLQEIALAVDTAEDLSASDFINQFCETEDIEENRAIRQIKAVWQALKDALSPGEVQDIQAQLPMDLKAVLR